jgi:hypothetical protein
MAEIVNMFAHEQQLNGQKPGLIESIFGVAQVAAESAVEWKTMADLFIDKWGLRPVQRTEAAVYGNPPAPAIYDYPSPWSKESLDQKIEDIRYGAETLGRQIKGLFNIAYDSPTGGQTAAPITTLGFAAIPPIAILALVALLVWFLIWRKK